MTSLANDLSQLDAGVRSFFDDERKLLIDGQWVRAASGDTFAVVDPSSGQEFAHVARAGSDDVDAAVAAARRAFESPDWRGMAPEARERLLWRLADLIEENATELGQIETVDNGMLSFMAREMNVMGAAGSIRSIGGWASKIFGKTANIVPPFPGAEFFGFTLKEPVGVVAAIVPWNVPFMLACWKLAPAIAAGCTIVIKPAELTSLSALKLGELVIEAGFPPGVVNIVTGPGSEAGAALVAHPDVNKVSFTGSTVTGKIINITATETIKRVTLELGGKSPTVIYNDANLDEAIPGAANGIFFNAGQVCVAGSRLYVQRGVYDQVVEGVAKHAEAIKVGAGMDPESQMGPLVSGDQLESVTGYIRKGAEEGGEIVAGGGTVDADGYFVRPTVITSTSHDATVVQEEIFGPVLVAMPFDDIDEVLGLSNDTVYGLAATVWTRDLSTAIRTVRGLDCGKVTVNHEGFPHPSMSEGGHKQSGFGRDLGEESVLGYLEDKSVMIRTR